MLVRNQPIWRAYRLFGLILTSDFPFQSTLEPASAVPGLRFTCVEDFSPPLQAYQQTKLMYESPIRTEDGTNILRVWRRGTGYQLHFASGADFCLFGEHLLCRSPDSEPAELVEIYLLGSVMAFVLALQGIPALHAAAAVVDDCAVAFLSNNQGGKTSLSASLMELGYQLLTDDLLPLQSHEGLCLAIPGYPQMRMWPEAAQHFLGHYEDLKLVHPDLTKRRVPVGRGWGRFCDAPRPLAAIYLPERHEGAGEVEITSISARNAVIELIRHSFSTRLVEAMGIHPHRLDFFATFVQRVPVQRLRYPSGFEHLPAVRDAILQDVKRLR